MTRFLLGRAFLAVIMAAGAAPQVVAQSVVEKPQFPPPVHEKQAPEVERNLRTFDTLDFDVLANQKWNRLGESHAKDIVAIRFCSGRRPRSSPSSTRSRTNIPRSAPLRSPLSFRPFGDS